jgi:hypothetical protein
MSDSADPSNSPVGEFQDAMRVEWARNMACAERWAEEYDLIFMEMERTLIFLYWKAEWWELTATLRWNQVSADVHRGLVAYAAKQAAISRQLAQSFATQWRPILATCCIRPNWWDPADNPLRLSLNSLSSFSSPTPAVNNHSSRFLRRSVTHVVPDNCDLDYEDEEDNKSNQNQDEDFFMADNMADEDNSDLDLDCE